MANKETVCPRHATLAEQEPDGTIIRSIGCRPCESTLRAMFSDGAWWPMGERPLITEDVLESLYQRYFMLVGVSMYDADGNHYLWKPAIPF